MEVTKFYDLQDMARIGCNDCRGCHACCQGMGDSVVLTPYDVHVLSVNLGKSVDALFGEWLQLTIVDGLLQPSMAMNGVGERCHGLDAQGRCSIHGFRPSICRLFPLGRQYTENGIKYFVLEDACPAAGKTKVKISKWVEREEFKEHEEFLIQLHTFKKQCLNKLEEIQDATYHKQLFMLVLQLFFRKPYTEGRFYEEFLERLVQAKEILA
jgi:Fe-S-cluster containining protein